MTKAELIDEYWDELRSELKECTESVYRSHGKIRYAIYCSKAEGVLVVEDVTGGSMAVHKPGYSLIAVIDHPYFDPWDTVDEEERPQDEWVAADMEDEVIVGLIDGTNWNEMLEEIQENSVFDEE